MRKPLFRLLLLAFLAAAAQSTASAQPRTSAQPAPTAAPNPTFDIFYTSASGGGRLTGRMFLILAHTDSVEPRLQVGRYGTQFFGVDFVDLPPDQAVHIDGTTLGYPINEMAAIPPGDYYVQAVLDRYTEFKRPDGHTLWMHMDQWEGQDWRRSPGNLYSKVQKITIGGTSGATTPTGANGASVQRIPLTVDQAMAPLPVNTDTKWVKHIKMKSKKLTAFWGQPIYIGATILLPKGYEAHPDEHYPPLRSAEPQPATDSQRAELNSTPGQPPREIGQWVNDLAAAHRTFAGRLADRQNLTIPAEDPRYGDLGRAFLPWPGRGKDAILQPPKPEIRPSPQVFERAADRDADWEAAD